MNYNNSKLKGMFCDYCGKELVATSKKPKNKHNFCDKNCYFEYRKQHKEEFECGRKRNPFKLNSFQNKNSIKMPKLEKMTPDELLFYGKIQAKKILEQEQKKKERK